MFEEVHASRHRFDRQGRKYRLQELLNSKKLDLINSYSFDSAEAKEVYLANLKYKPQKTFELWNPITSVPSEKGDKKKKRKLETDNEEDDNDLDEEDEEIEEDEEEEEVATKLKKYESLKFAAISKGYEILGPRTVMMYERTDEEKDEFSDGVSFDRYNVKMLNTFLHLSVLRKQWERASTCFGLLIRMNNVDIRTIWPLGLEILTRMEESKLQQEAKLAGTDLNSYQLRILSNFLPTTTPPPFLIELEKLNMQKLLDLIKTNNSQKVGKFLNWLRNYYDFSTLAFSKVDAPAWRSGSKVHSPLYFQSLIWFLLLKFDFKNCKDLLNELILQPPFSTDGNYYFFLAICYQIEASYSYDMKILPFKDISQLLKSSLQNYLICVKDYKYEISSNMLKDLKKSFHLIGLQNVDEMFTPFIQSSVDEKHITPTKPSSPPSSASSSSSSSSSPASSIVKHEPYDSDSESVDHQNTKMMEEGFNSLSLSPFSQAEFSPATPLHTIGQEQRHRTRNQQGIGSVLDLNNNKEIEFEFDDESNISSD